MRLAALQFAPAWEDRETNYARVRTFAAQARDQGADWLILPEMFATGFSMNPGFTAEAEDGPTTRFLRDLARDLGLGVVGGLVLEGEAGLGRNAALAVDPEGQVAALYVKTHLFAYMDEDSHHQAGDAPVPFDLGPLRAACFICYDLRFPELFRLVADQCQLMLVIASWPAARQRHWDVLLPARAVENQCYVLGLNRVGEGGGHPYSGGSALYDPLGQPLFQAGPDEALLLADLDPDLVTDVRARMPFLRDRRF